MAETTGVDNPMRRRNVLRGGAATVAAAAAATLGGTDPAGATLTEPYITFVYAPSGSASRNRYTSWSDLCADLALAPYGRKYVRFEEDCTIPTGAWNLQGATLTGTSSVAREGEIKIVTFPSGCTISNPGVLVSEHGVWLLSTSDEPVMTIEGNAALEFATDCVVIATDAPFFRVQNTLADGLVVFGFRFGGGFSKASDVPVESFALLDDAPVVENLGEAAVAVVFQAGPCGIKDFTLTHPEPEENETIGPFVLVNASPATGIDFGPGGLVRNGFTHDAGVVVIPVDYCQAMNIGISAIVGLSATTVQGALAELLARIVAIEGVL